MAATETPGQAAADSPGHGPAHAAAVAAGYRDREPFTVTALFDGPERVDAALDALYTAGTPRDLIEVVVSREAAAKFYGGRRRVRGPGRETFRFAGIGALAGFVAGCGVSLVMVALPGIEAPGGMAPVALFGPNAGTIGGGAVGALLGYFRRQQPDARHARAAEASGAIVLAVAARGEREAALLAGLLGARGGRDVRREAAGA